MAVARVDSEQAAVPSLEQARELARDYNLIPVRETFIDDTQTPVSAFLKLRGQRARGASPRSCSSRLSRGGRALLVHRRRAPQGDPLVAR